jgi:hypothetical protein
MRDPTPHQTILRQQVVTRVRTHTASQIFDRSGDRLGHRPGPWSPFDNTGSFQDLLRSVTDIGTRQLAVQDEPVLAAAHLDNIQLAACALALRGLHDGHATFEGTIASAHAGVATLKSRLKGQFVTAFDPLDLRMLYEAVAGQAPRRESDGVLRPSIGWPSEDIFPGGVRFVLAQQLLADAAASWPARPDGLRWALMWFVQTEIAERRIEPIQEIAEVENARVEPERVPRFLDAFDKRLNTQQYYLPVSRTMFRAGQRRNRALCPGLRDSFESALTRRQSPGQALHRTVIEAERLARGGTRRPRKSS